MSGSFQITLLFKCQTWRLTKKMMSEVSSEHSHSNMRLTTQFNKCLANMSVKISFVEIKFKFNFIMVVNNL